MLCMAMSISCIGNDKVTLSAYASEYMAGLFVWREGLRAGVHTLTESRDSFTVSALLWVFVGLASFWLVFFSSSWMTRTSFHDCHNRHDERSTGAKKKKEEMRTGWIAAMDWMDFSPQRGLYRSSWAKDFQVTRVYFLNETQSSNNSTTLGKTDWPGFVDHSALAIHKDLDSTLVCWPIFNTCYTFQHRLWRLAFIEVLPEWWHDIGRMCSWWYMSNWWLFALQQSTILVFRYIYRFRFYSIGLATIRLFLSGCCMAQRRSLSGRSPFCQRKQSDSRKFTGNFYPRINKLETKHEKTPTTCSLPESAGAVGCGLFLGRLDQGLVGNAESTHVNRPKGKATLVP